MYTVKKKWNKEPLLNSTQNLVQMPLNCTKFWNKLMAMIIYQERLAHLKFYNRTKKNSCAQTIRSYWSDGQQKVLPRSFEMIGGQNYTCSTRIPRVKKLLFTAWQRTCAQCNYCTRLFSQKTSSCDWPYLPDLVPCDFFLIPKLKIPFKGCYFEDVDTIRTAVMHG